MHEHKVTALVVMAEISGQEPATGSKNPESINNSFQLKSTPRFTCWVAHFTIKLTLRSRQQGKNRFSFCTWKSWVPERGDSRSHRTNGGVKTSILNSPVLSHQVHSSLSHTKNTLSSTGYVKPSPVRGITRMFQNQMPESKSILLPFFFFP